MKIGWNAWKSGKTTWEIMQKGGISTWGVLIFKWEIFKLHINYHYHNFHKYARMLTSVIWFLNFYVTFNIYFFVSIKSNFPPNYYSKYPNTGVSTNQWMCGYSADMQGDTSGQQTDYNYIMIRKPLIDGDSIGRVLDFCSRNVGKVLE